MAASWKPSSTYAMALVAKSPEASSSQWDPPTVTRRPQNGLSPTNPPPLLLAAADLQRGSCQVSLWASRHCVCCSQAHPSKVGVSVARVTDPRRTRLGQSQICPSSQSHCHAQMFQVPSRLLGMSRLGSLVAVILIVPHQPSLPTCPYEPHTSQNSRLRVE